MAKLDSDLQLQVIVVGSSTDELVHRTMNSLGDHGVEYILCDDVYSAVGELARNESGNVLVIGRFGQLSREQGRFFHMACDNGYTCFCIADRELVRKRKQILTAIEAGAFVTNEPAEIGEVVTKLLQGSSPEKKGSGKTPKSIKDEFVTTKAELDSLLGAGAPF